MMYEVKYKIMNLAHEHEGDSNEPEKNKRMLFETTLNIGNNPSIYTKIKVLQVLQVQDWKKLEANYDL